jgi:hypothetical protein
MTPDYLNYLSNGNLMAATDRKGYGPMTRGGGGLQDPSLSTFGPYGAVITAEWLKLVSDVSTGPYPLAASETVYLLPPNGSVAYPRINPLQAAGSVIAEIVFDSPLAFINAATGPQVTSLDAWAVALNFKTGTANDDSRDYRLGAHCQFTNGGELNFREDGGADPQKVIVAAGGSYKDYSNTTFTLTVQLDRTATTGQATATLKLTGAPPQGAQTPTPFIFQIPNLSEIIDTTNLLTAVGFTIVNQIPGFVWVEGQGYVGDAHDVRVHITSFTLQYNP